MPDRARARYFYKQQDPQIVIENTEQDKVKKNRSKLKRKDLTNLRQKDASDVIILTSQDTTTQ